MYLSSISSRLLLYDTSSWTLKKSYGCYEGILKDISWSDDSKYLLQVNCKGLVEILSAVDHDVRSLQHIPLKDTWSASFHRDGHRNIAIGTRSGNVLIWDTKNKNITKTFPTPPQQSTVNFISYNAKNTSLAASMYNGDTIIYGLVSNIPVLTVKLPYSKNISSMKFHHESRSVLGLATEEGHVVLRDITTNKDKTFFKNVHAAPVSDFAYSFINKDVMLSSGYDKVMHVYDVRLQNVVSTTRTSHILTTINLNSDNLVALGTKTGSVLVYDLRDLTNPLTVLSGHDTEVRRVAFQPIRKKLNSPEISLKEETATMTTPTVKSPVKNNRNSDLYYLTDSPPQNNSEPTSPQDNKADSFLVLMGLDKSKNIEEEENLSLKVENKTEQFILFKAEKDYTEMSTPLNHNNNKMENFNLPSPVHNINGMPDDGKNSFIDMNRMNQQNNFTNSLDMKHFEELKDFIKLNIADVADDNRNYFLHVMMALTKQKLFLEKQLYKMNEQMQMLAENQTAIMEVNRKLALEVDILKNQRKHKC